MSSASKIHFFFLSLALLFWNPLSFCLVYGHTPAYTFKLIHAAYWLIFITGVVVLVLLTKNKPGEKIKNSVFMLSVAGILFAALVLLNTFFEKKNNPVPAQFRNPDTQGLIFPPNSTATYSTPEFSYTTAINSIGLRNKEVAVNKGKNYRIVCLGDSWTLGWGVTPDDSWPQKLESYLKKAGIPNVEVINGGQPGAYTPLYKANLARMVPFLKPDLVLVGVLQLDDLAQLYENSDRCAESLLKSHQPKIRLDQKIKFAVTTFFKFSFGNLVAAMRLQKPVAVNASTNRESVNELIAFMDSTEKKRLAAMDASLRNLFSEGSINPGLLRQYTGIPDRELRFNDPSNADARFALLKMKQDFADMKAICKSNRCELVFVNLPANYFSGHYVIRHFNDSVNNYLEQHNHVDSMYRAVAAANRLPYIGLTKRFRSLENKNDYFFRYDAHPTAKGYDEIAKGIAEELLKRRLLPFDGRFSIFN